jgi:hypothetical protein
MERSFEEIRKLLDSIIKREPGREDFWGEVSISFRQSQPVGYTIMENGKISEDQKKAGSLLGRSDIGRSDHRMLGSTIGSFR